MIDVIPQLLLAIVLFIVGLVISGLLGKAVVYLVNALKVDEAADRLGIKEIFGAFKNFSIANLLGVIVKWFFIIFFLVAVADILGWSDLTDLLQQIFVYIPQIFIAVIIILAGLILGKIMGDFVTKSIEGTDAPVKKPSALGALAKWIFIILAFIAAIQQLGIAIFIVDVVNNLVLGLALAFALAFGLGGKDKAKEWLDRM